MESISSVLSFGAILSRASGPRHLRSLRIRHAATAHPSHATMDANLAAFEGAFAADPKTVLLVLGDISPAEEPVHDYITDINERCALFGELQQLHQDLDTEMPNAATLGFFMVAPTSGIREHLVAIRNTPPAFRVQLLDHINLKAAAAMDSCMLRSPPVEHDLIFP